MKFLIQSPIWSSKSVGLDDSKIEDHNEIEITYRNKVGFRIYPETYEMDGATLKSYPTQRRFGVDLRIVPIKDLKVKEESYAWE